MKFPSFVPGTLASRIATVAAYATTVLIWGTTWLGIKSSLAGLPPTTGAGFRFIVAGIALYLVAFALRVDFRKHAPPPHLVFVLALTMFGLNYVLTYLAETHLASGLVAVLFGTLPFFVFAFAHFMVGERSTPRTIGGALLALGGVAAISLGGDWRGDVVYVLATLLAAASSGFANVYLKRYADAEPFATLPPAMLLAGLAMAAGGFGYEHIDWNLALRPQTIGAVAYLALGGSALAFYLNHWLLQRISSGIMGLSALMIPVLAVTVGTIVGHEAFSGRDLIGAALVILGVWYAMTQTRQSTVAAPRRPAAVTPEAAAEVQRFVEFESRLHLTVL